MERSASDSEFSPWEASRESLGKGRTVHDHQRHPNLPTVTSPILYRSRYVAVGVFALVILSMLALVHRNSLAVVMNIETFHRQLSIGSNAEQSRPQQCDPGTISMLIETKISKDHKSVRVDDIPDSRNSLRQQAISRKALISIEQQKITKGDKRHEFSAYIPLDRSSKSLFCLKPNSEYTFSQPQQSKDKDQNGDNVHSAMKWRVCGEVIADYGSSESIQVVTDNDKCSATLQSASTIKSKEVDCTDEPTSRPTSMPTMFIKGNSSSSAKTLYESTTFISTVSAVGGTAVVGTVGGVAYAAARSAKYFIQVPLAPDNLAMQI